MFESSILAPIILMSFMLTADRPDEPPPAPAPAPPPRPRLPLDIGVDMEPHNTLFFLETPAFQRELKVTPDTLARAKELKQKMRRSIEIVHEGFVAELRNLVGQGDKVPEMINLERDREVLLLDIQKRTESATRELLEPRRRARLEQIELQAIGPGVFIAPNFKEVRARLNLDAGQAEAINALAQRCSDELIRVSTPPPGYDGPGFTQDRRRAHHDSMHGEAARVRESTMNAIGKVLSREQRAAYRAMLGEPFDFSRVRSRPYGKAS